MDNEIWLKLIDNIPQILLAVGIFIASIVGTILTIFVFRRAGRAEKAAADSLLQSQLNAGKITVIGENVDGKMDKLLEAREDAAGARGELKERDTEREHQKDK